MQKDIAKKVNQAKGQFVRDTLQGWHRDYYQGAIVQRNLFVLIALLAIVATVLSVITIRHIKNTKSIEPFVIEIEKKTGIPTVVDPLRAKEYSANESVKRFLVTQYIKAREEFFFQTYEHNYNNLVRALSDSNVYYGQYRSEHSKNNPSSNFNMLGTSGTAVVKWKSIMFVKPNTAQVRFVLETRSGGILNKVNKIALVSFEFSKKDLPESDRLLNPLGFSVKLYRIENESVE